MKRYFDIPCADPTELSFIYDWSVQIFQQLNGFNVFGDTETFCTNFRCASHEWFVAYNTDCNDHCRMAHLYRTNFGASTSPRTHLYLEHTRVMASSISPKKCKFSFRVIDGSQSFQGC
ncbi:unnamed protein product [Toxocara canis]|uniref:ZP domain-containing protein n=1 Tax=Toxocara canis TaxID=6265 RepID=A0A183U8M8_TOXCA|nr:unnamed protein product [Toxocara canis]